MCHIGDVAVKYKVKFMYCKYCGKEISEHAEICIHCGARIKDATTTTAPIKDVTTVKLAKSPTLALFLSLIIVGLGQIYNGQILKGIVMFVVAFITGITIIGLVIAIPIWLYGMYDAYNTAKKT